MSKSSQVLFVIMVIVLVFFLWQYVPILFRLDDLAGGPRVLSKIETIPGQEVVTSEVETLGEAVDPFSLRVPVSKVGGGGPAVASNTTSANYVPKASFSLGGIWIYGNIKYALIGDDSVAEGEIVDGWRVKAIGDKRVILERQGQQKVLQLETEE